MAAMAVSFEDHFKTVWGNKAGQLTPAGVIYPQFGKVTGLRFSFWGSFYPNGHQLGYFFLIDFLFTAILIGLMRFAMPILVSDG